jgi:hypothetical protein
VQPPAGKGYGKCPHSAGFRCPLRGDVQALVVWGVHYGARFVAPTPNPSDMEGPIKGCGLGFLRGDQQLGQGLDMVFVLAAAEPGRGTTGTL